MPTRMRIAGGKGPKLATLRQQHQPTGVQGPARSFARTVAQNGLAHDASVSHPSSSMEQGSEEASTSYRTIRWSLNPSMHLGSICPQDAEVTLFFPLLRATRHHHPRRRADWRKSSLYLLRTDGKSCSRELVSGKDGRMGLVDGTAVCCSSDRTRASYQAACVCVCPLPGSGKLTFAYPSTQQHLLVWRHQPKR